MVESVLQTVYDNHVEELAIDLDGIPSNIDVSQAVLKVEKLWINGLQTGRTGQREAILRAVIEAQDFHLKYLYLGSKVSEVSPDLLASAALKVDTLEFDGSTPGQVGEILTRLASTEDSKLRVLDLGFECVDISHLPPEPVTEGLLKLQSVSRMIQQLLLSPGQMTHLFTKIRDIEDPWFDHFPLLQIDLLQLDPDVLAGAVTRIDQVEMRVTAVQIQSVLTKIHLGGCKLRHLELQETDLSLVTTEVLIGALRKMEYCETDFGIFTRAQVAAILNMVTARSQGNLKKLRIFSPIIDEETFSLLVAAEENEILEISKQTYVL